MARDVLPQSVKTEIVVTCTEEEWQHIIDLRYRGLTGNPHPQMKAIMSFIVKDLEDESEGRIVLDEAELVKEILINRYNKYFKLEKEQLLLKIQNDLSSEELKQIDDLLANIDSSIKNAKEKLNNAIKNAKIEVETSLQEHKNSHKH